MIGTSFAFNCFFNSLFRMTPKKTSKLWITGPSQGEFIDDWWIPSQITSIAERVVMMRPGASFALIMTSQMETFPALLAFCAGNSPIPGEFPSQRPVARSFDVFFDLHQDKRLSKQSWGWWFETPSRPLWRHCKHIPEACVGVFNAVGPILNLAICAQSYTEGEYIYVNT